VNFLKVTFGFFLPPFSIRGRYDWRTARATALEAEKLGFDSLWVSDHLIWGVDGANMEGWTTLCSLAPITKVRLGMGVLCNSYRYPSLLAKMASTLDVISDGRLDFGIGAGWKRDEYEAYGIPYPRHGERVERLGEALEIFKRMWTEDAPSFEGKYYTIKNAICEPKPIQKPHPPIWIGGSKDRIMTLVAKYADVWDVPIGDPSGGGGGGGANATAEGMLRAIRVLEQKCKEQGKDPGKIRKSWTPWVCIARSESELKKKVEEWLSILRVVPPYSTYPMHKATFQTARENCIVGTPEECVKRVQEFVDIGFTNFTLGFADLPSMQMARLFAEEVIPHFR
jgi:alkanesulfonate monooxygenase SsuD/methylene tetrahydromethanopterin reductase-like flavin-dependent oxidoreductase (luciferase family)